MPEITVHMMCRNEEHWIGPILENLCQVFPHVIAADCGSVDATPTILTELSQKYVGRLEIFLFNVMNAEQNGRVRQLMTDATKTEWAAIIDGDEYYSIAQLKLLLETELPETTRLAYTTLQVVVFENGQFYRRERWSKQCLFHVPSTHWEGAFPFEVPKPWVDIADPATRHYYPDILGYDLHHLPRSRYDKQTAHRLRKDKIRRLMPKGDSLPELLEEFRETRWSNPVLDEIHALA